MSDLLQGNTVLISGAGPGLGVAVARAALREGANLALGARDAARLQELARELDPTGQRVISAALDITRPETIDALVRAAKERFGRLDSLVQIAAQHVMGGAIETGNDEWRNAYETNVIGSVACIRAVVPQMQAQRAGSIVLVGSQAAFRPNISEGAYGATKGALISAMYYLADELGPSGIRVNTVVPSWMWGPALQGYVQAEASRLGVTEQSVIDGITARFPLRRLVADSDVAETVVFFASERARMITGQSLLVNAGEMMR